MRVKKCRKCKTTIPAKARVCPYCFKSQWTAALTVLFVIILIFIIVGGYIKLTHKRQVESDTLSPAEVATEKRTGGEIQSMESMQETIKDVEKEEEKRLLGVEGLEEERLEKERIERALIEKEKAERERLRMERLLREQQERESVQRKIEERERTLREKAEKEQVENEQQSTTPYENESIEVDKEIEPPAIIGEDAANEGIAEDVILPVEESMSEQSQDVEGQDQEDTKE